MNVIMKWRCKWEIIGNRIVQSHLWGLNEYDGYGIWNISWWYDRYYMLGYWRPLKHTYMVISWTYTLYRVVSWPYTLYAVFIPEYDLMDLWTLFRASNSWLIFLLLSLIIWVNLRNLEIPIPTLYNRKLHLHHENN